jgi:hypothetical protein
MEFVRVYQGKVNSVRQEYISPTGMRHYEITFRDGKKMTYHRSQKQVMLIVPGNVIRFTANKVEPFDYWVINEVLESFNPEVRIVVHHIVF